VKTLANTTVLSNFAAVDRLDLIRQLRGRLYISNEVYEEILDGLEEGYDFYAGIDAQIHPFDEAGWIELVSMADEEELRLFRSLPRRLHRGEASCLAIARHRGWAFLTDDKLARVTARAWGIVLSGTLGVLVQAVKRELLMREAADGLLQEMIARGYRSPYTSLRRLLENDQ
jgi:predicted nucleic acid-binding protein